MMGLFRLGWRRTRSVLLLPGFFSDGYPRMVHLALLPVESSSSSMKEFRRVGLGNIEITIKPDATKEGICCCSRNARTVQDCVREFVSAD